MHESSNGRSTEPDRSPRSRWAPRVAKPVSARTRNVVAFLVNLTMVALLFWLWTSGAPKQNPAGHDDRDTAASVRLAR